MKINNNKIKSLILLSLLNSATGKEDNQTELTLNSLPQMGTNFTKRGNETDPKLIFAGYPVSFGVDAYVEEVFTTFKKQCTASFIVVNTNNTDCADGHFLYENEYGGFLTSVFCFPNEARSGTLAKDVYSWDDSLLLGTLGYNNLWYDKIDLPLIDRNYVRRSGDWNNMKLIPYVMGEEAGQENLYPVTGFTDSVMLTPGSKVCAYGAVSGHLCGNFVEANIELRVPNIWKLVNDDQTMNLLTMEKLGKVDLGESGFRSEQDLGGPVYLESKIGDQTTAQALGHITHFDNSDPNHKLLYYTPLDKALERTLERNGCTYSLLTYNENNAQEYDQLLAQMEIPTKK